MISVPPKREELLQALAFDGQTTMYVTGNAAGRTFHIRLNDQTFVSHVSNNLILNPSINLLTTMAIFDLFCLRALCFSSFIETERCFIIWDTDRHTPMH